MLRFSDDAAANAWVRAIHAVARANHTDYVRNNEIVTFSPAKGPVKEVEMRQKDHTELPAARLAQLTVALPAPEVTAAFGDPRREDRDEDRAKSAMKPLEIVIQPLPELRNFSDLRALVKRRLLEVFGLIRGVFFRFLMHDAVMCAACWELSRRYSLVWRETVLTSPITQKRC